MGQKTIEAYSGRLTVGSCRPQGGNLVSEHELRQAIREFLESRTEESWLPVTVSQIMFLAKGYEEPKWSVRSCNLPKRNLSISKFREFLLALGQFLLARFEQETVTVEFPDLTTTLD